jgi:hypothetical protein
LAGGGIYRVQQKSCKFLKLNDIIMLKINIKNRWGDRVEEYPMLKNYFTYFSGEIETIPCPFIDSRA